MKLKREREREKLSILEPVEKVFDIFSTKTSLEGLSFKKISPTFHFPFPCITETLDV